MISSLEVGRCDLGSEISKQDFAIDKTGVLKVSLEAFPLL